MINLLLVLQVAMVDSSALATVAKVYKVPPLVMQTVAYLESRNNVKPPRGPGVVKYDSLGKEYRACREYGRMQINPCVHKQRMCMAAKRLYRANLHCGALLLRQRYVKFGSWERAIKRYNGNGPMADEYLTKALVYAGRKTLRGL